jgi:hypothetical protein
MEPRLSVLARILNTHPGCCPVQLPSGRWQATVNGQPVEQGDIYRLSMAIDDLDRR